MDFGKVNIPTKWEDITLKQFCELMRVYEKDDKEVLDVLEVLSGKTKSELRQMPADFIDTMMQHLQFMNIPLNVEADSKIVINGEEYKVNYTEKLKFGEWTDAETVLKEKDYAGLLAILARKNGEIYNDDFIANELDKRIELFNSLSITKALVLLNFFFKVKAELYSLFPKVFGEQQGSNRIISPVYKKFSEGWGWQHILYSLCENKIEKIGEVAQMYLTTVLMFMSYQSDRAVAERAQNELDETIRKQKKK